MVSGAKRLAITGSFGSSAPQADELFPKVNPTVDGEDCLQDCASCPTHYPRNFKIEESDELYGHVKGWATHVLVATGKTDWVRDVADEKGSLMEAFEKKADKPNNGRLMLSASNMPTPNHSSDYAEPTTLLVLPAFTLVENVLPEAVPAIVSEYINNAPTNTSPLAPTLSAAHNIAVPPTIPPSIKIRPCPHRVLVLLCSQGTRDARCGQSAPLIRKELERHLRPLGLYRDLDDERPGGVGIYFISHVGGHKYSANMMVYRRPDAFGVDGVERAQLEGGGGGGQDLRPMLKKGGETGETEEDVGAAQCMWLARVRPEDCEGIVKYTILQGKLVKPERQLRGGFDRSRGVMSW